jgi:hypothetical protein
VEQIRPFRPYFFFFILGVDRPAKACYNGTGAEKCPAGGAKILPESRSGVKRKNPHYKFVMLKIVVAMPTNRDYIMKVDEREANDDMD